MSTQKLNKRAELAVKLQRIKEAVNKAEGNPKTEAKLLGEIVDPQDKNNCEGCQ